MVESVGLWLSLISSDTNLLDGEGVFRIFSSVLPQGDLSKQPPPRSILGRWLWLFGLPRKQVPGGESDKYLKEERDRNLEGKCTW